MRTITVLLIFVVATAEAKETCDFVPKFREIANTSRTLKPRKKNAAGFAEDHGMTARAVEKIFGANGDFSCGGFSGQAQLTETDHHIHYSWSQLAQSYGMHA